MHQEDYKIHYKMSDSIEFMEKYEADTIYYNQAMKQTYRNQWMEEMVKEVKNHTKRKNWKLVPIKEVPTGTGILDAMWSTKCKRDILSKRVMK